MGVWTCVDGCEQVFRERHAFETHILKEHLQANLRLNTDDIKDVVDSCEQQEDLSASRQWTCEFCGRLIEGTRALLRLHVGQHMVGIALKVLPQDCLEDEELDEGYADEPGGVSLNSLASTVNQFAYENGKHASHRVFEWYLYPD